MKLRYRYNWKDKQWEFIGLDEERHCEIIFWEDGTVVAWSVVEDARSYDASVPFERLH